MVSIREHHCLQLFHYIYRHVQVATMMKREKVHIKHRFDPWHLAKSVRKDLVAASKKRECTELASWTASVVNTCGGARRLLMEINCFARRNGSQSFTMWPAYTNGLMFNYFLPADMMNLLISRGETRYGFQLDLLLTTP